MYKKNYDNHYLDKLQVFLNRTKLKSYELLNANANDVILDIGCGNGQDVLNIAKSGATIIGIDHDIEFIKIANQQNKDNLDVKFICCEASDIPLESNSIDKIKFDRVLQHIENSDALIKEAGRLLKTGGTLQIIDTDYLSWSLFLEDVNLERKIFDIIAHQRFKGAHKIRKLPARMEENKFRITHFEVHNYIVNEFDFANYIVRFDTIVNEELEKGNITSTEFKVWQKYKGSPINLSINLLIYMAIKIL